MEPGGDRHDTNCGARARSPPGLDDCLARAGRRSTGSRFPVAPFGLADVIRMAGERRAEIEPRGHSHAFLQTDAAVDPGPRGPFLLCLLGSSASSPRSSAALGDGNRPVSQSEHGAAAKPAS